MFCFDMLEHPREIGLNEAPSAHVPRLLLAPDHLGILEARKLLDQRAGRERIQLLEPEQVDIVDPALLALLVEIVIDLAGAEHHSPDLGVGNELDRLVRQELRIVPQKAVEGRATSELREARYHPLVTEQRLRRHQHQRLAELAVGPPAPDKGKIGWRGAIRNLHIVLWAEVERTLEPRPPRPTAPC